MAKRIFRNVVLTAILAVLITAALIVPSLYTVYENRMSRELRQEAEVIDCALEMAEDDLNYLEKVDKTFVFANPNKKHISIQEFEKQEVEQLVDEE